MSAGIDPTEEIQRSKARRGIIGHYIAGAYRVVMRPITTEILKIRARWREFIWGMEEVSLLVKQQPQRYLAPLLREFGATVAEDAHIDEGLWIVGVIRDRYHPLKIGRKVYIARNIMIDLAEDVEVGDFSILCSKTLFVSHTDFAHSPLKKRISPMKRGTIRIGRGAFIASNTMIAHSTTIGECAIVGASSFVDKDVPPFTFVAGTPARVIARINPENVDAFDPDTAIIIPKGSTVDDFDYESPTALKIPEGIKTISAS